MISAVPFPTSKCLLPFPLLCCLLLSPAEATAHNIWQQLSGCAEKHLLFQITALIQEAQRHLVISCNSQHGDRKRGRRDLGSSHFRNEDVETGEREHMVNTAQSSGVQTGREACAYWGTLATWLSFMYIEFCGCLYLWIEPKVTTVTK